MTQPSAACSRAEEIVARETANIALTEVDHAIVAWDAGKITVQDVLARIVYAGDLAARAQTRGWDFLGQRKGWSA